MQPKDMRFEFRGKISSRLHTVSVEKLVDYAAITKGVHSFLRINTELLSRSQLESSFLGKPPFRGPEDGPRFACLPNPLSLSLHLCVLQVQYGSSE